jgi:hypothetical protein
MCEGEERREKEGGRRGEKCVEMVYDKRSEG